MQIVNKKKPKYQSVSCYPNFFIIGSQRSGTTLLRLILNNHSKIAVPEESTFLMPLLKNQSSLNIELSESKIKRIFKYIISNSQFKQWNLPIKSFDKMKSNNVKNIIEYLYKSYGEKYQKPMVGDKTPSFIRKMNIIHKIFPKSKYIHIIRDGRDTYISLKKQDHHSIKTVIQYSLEWTIKELIIQRFLNKLSNKQYIEIRYEDLIISPECEIRKLCDFLEVEWENEMLDFHKNSKTFIEDSHSELIFKPIFHNNFNKWKKQLSVDEIIEFQYFSTRILKKYKYKILYHKLLSIKKILIIYGKLIITTPKRIFHIIKTSVVMKINVSFGLKSKSELYH